MSSLETAQYVWEATTKKFDKIDNEKKKEWFISLINQLDENSNINRLKNKRNSMTNEQKLKLYNRQALTISNALKKWSPIYTIFRSIIDRNKHASKNWSKNALKFSFLEQIPCRFFVELGIFNKPEWLTDQKLIDDVKKDAKDFNIYLWFCETVCKCIPEAKAAVPFIWMARHYSKRYKDHGTETIATRLTEKKEMEIKEQTNQELAEVLKDEHKKAA